MGGPRFSSGKNDPKKTDEKCRERGEIKLQKLKRAKNATTRNKYSKNNAVNAKIKAHKNKAVHGRIEYRDPKKKTTKDPQKDGEKTRKREIKALNIKSVWRSRTTTVAGGQRPVCGIQGHNGTSGIQGDGGIRGSISTRGLRNDQRGIFDYR